MDRPMTRKGAPLLPKAPRGALSRSWHGLCSLVTLAEIGQQGKEEAVWSSTSQRNNNHRSLKTGSRGLRLT